MTQYDTQSELDHEPERAGPDAAETSIHLGEDDVLLSMAELKLEVTPISWWSLGRLGQKLLHIIEGDVESGVDEFLAYAVAQLSTGRGLPGGRPSSPSTVLLATVPCDFAAPYIPLLQAAGAEDTRIFSRAFAIPDDFDRLERHIVRHQVDVVLFPNLFAASPTKLSYDADCWPIIRGFKRLISQTGVTVILSRGVPKSVSKSTKPIHRGAGAPAWAEVADVILFAERDGDQVTIETVRQKHGNKPGPLHFEILRWPGVNSSRIVFPEHPEANPPEGQAPDSCTGSVGTPRPQVTITQKIRSRRTRTASSPGPGGHQEAAA